MALGVLQKPIRAVRLSTFNSSLLAQRRRRCTSENGDEHRASFHIIIIFFKRAVSHTHIVLVFLVCASVSLWGHVGKTLSGECRKSRQPFFFVVLVVLQILQHTPDDGKCSKHLHNIVQAFFLVSFPSNWIWRHNLLEVEKITNANVQAFYYKLCEAP